MGISRIISASRRTDIPCCYPEWLIKRLTEGFCEVSNPYNARMVRRVSLLPGDMDALILWSKNPSPLLPYKEFLSAYPYMLEYTINDMPKSVEPHLPPLGERIETLLRFSELIGPSRVIWRYDPIAYTPEIGFEAHAEKFYRIARAVSGACERCVISFLDVYPNLKKRMETAGLYPPDQKDMHALAKVLSDIGRAFGITLSACAEAEDFSKDGLLVKGCLDADDISRALHKTISAERDKNQRNRCLCISSVDIGRYGTCTNSCAYCYANRSAHIEKADNADKPAL
ncbi:MAG: DUF1848 domain-containing protein [Clostridia bacterium]|nr:DUF1848 domain-containing protein [Clostridia bacterium]